MWGNLQIEAKFPNGQRGYFTRATDFSDAEGAFAVEGTSVHSDRDSAEPKWAYSLCSSCLQSAVWRGSVMIFPAELTVPEAHPSMPEDARMLYEEARATLPVSRRAAAALARASLESLLREIEPGNKSKRLDEMLATMKTRFGDDLWQLLTALRVAGNDVLHGDRDDLVVLLLDGEADVVIEPFFGAINTIVDKEIAQPARTQALYELIPQTKREAAEAKALSSGSLPEAVSLSQPSPEGPHRA